MAAILFVHGGPEAARTVFSRERRVDWSQGLPVVLEKWGLLDVSAMTLREFCAEPPPEPACVLLADVAAVVPAPALLARLESLRAPVLFGAPPPPELRALLGIAAVAPVPAAGAVRALDPTLHSRAGAYGYAPGAGLGVDRVRTVERDPALDWERLSGVPIDSAQRDAWRAPGPPGQRWSLDGATDVVAECAIAGAQRESWPAIVRRDRFRACSFHLFERLARAHTSEPWASQEHRSSPRMTGLETLLLALIDEMHEEAGRARLRALPWPRGAAWALNVRHDFDRALRVAQVRDVLAAHAAAGTRATWYWKAQHLGHRRWPSGGNRALRRVADQPAHEIAHHTERLWDGADAEQERIESVARRAVRGTCAHGDPRCFRFQGAPNVLWAEQRRLDYTELIQQAHFHPHRFLAPAPDGSLRTARVICLPHHESFDLSMRDGDTNEQRIMLMAERYRAVGGLLQVMNHPDLNQRRLFATLAALPAAGRWDCTAGAAADWWAHTHVDGAIDVRPVGSDAYDISSPHRVEGLGLELLGRDRSITRLIVDLAPGIPTRVAADLGATVG